MPDKILENEIDASANSAAKSMVSPEAQITDQPTNTIDDQANILSANQPAPKNRFFGLFFRGKKDQVSIASSRRINKKLVLLPVLLVAVFGSYLLVSSFAATPPAQITGNQGLYNPVTPARIIDTATGLGGIKGPLKINQTVEFVVTGKGGVPATGVSSVVLRATALSPTEHGYLTLYPADGPKPTTSNLVFTGGGSTVTNTLNILPSSTGKIKIFSYSNNTNPYYFDVIGYYSAPTGPNGLHFIPVNPSRIADTRSGVGVSKAQIPANGTIDIQITNRGNIADTFLGAKTKVATINITTIAPKTAGQLLVWPADQVKPLVGSIAYPAGSSSANEITTNLSPDGKVKLLNNNNSPVDISIDGLGFYAQTTSGQAQTMPGSRYVAIQPTRLVDTRTNTGGSKKPLNPAEVRNFKIAGTNNIPTNAKAVVTNIGVSDQTSAGHLRAWQAGSPLPETSILNFIPHYLANNSSTVIPSSTGEISVHNSSGSSNVIIDAYGYFIESEPIATKPPTTPPVVTEPPVTTTPPAVINPVTGTVPNGKIYTLTASDYTAIKNDTNGLYDKKNKIDETKASSAYLNKIVNDTKYDTIVFPKLVTSEKKGKETVVPWLVNPIMVTRSNVKLLLANGAIIQAKAGYPNARGVINVTNANNNVHIEGGAGSTIKMVRDDYAPKWDYNRGSNNEKIAWPEGGIFERWASSEFRAGVVFRGAKNSSIKNVAIDGTAGDGITIGTYPKDKSATHNENITIDNVYVYNVARNGISLGNVNGLSLSNSTFTHTNAKITDTKKKGIAKSLNEKNTPNKAYWPSNKINVGPWAGIDFEPNFANEPLTNIKINKTQFTDNAGGGINLVFGNLNNTTPPISITIDNCTSGVNQAYYNQLDPHEKATVNGRGLVFYADTDRSASKNPVSGNISINNCKFVQPIINSANSKLPILKQSNRPTGSPTLSINGILQPNTK